MGFSLVVKSGGYSPVVMCVGFSLRGLLLWGTGSRGPRLQAQLQQWPHMAAVVEAPGL